jgi:hypothetical protein
MQGGGDAEATLRMGAPPPAQAPRPGDSGARMLIWAAAAAGLVVFAAVYFLFLTPPKLRMPTADAAEILAARPAHLLVFRFEPDPNVVVLDFPTLREQGQMLNRVAALVEKAGAPRDRVLTDSELAAAIRASGATPDTYYYGHDYRAADLVRFFRLMALDHVRPNPEERRLRALLAQLRWFAAGAVGAIITLPGPGVAPGLDPAGRATILEHELAHGAYFTIPAYDVYAQHFFHDDLKPAERELFRRFLASEGYDTGISDLVINETQAYLLFTADPRFFNAGVLGMAPARLQDLRRIFWQHIPVAWLKRSVAEPALAPRTRLPPAPITLATPPARALQRQRRACVSRRRAIASSRSFAVRAAVRARARASR